MWPFPNNKSKGERVNITENNEKERSMDPKEKDVRGHISEVGSGYEEITPTTSEDAKPVLKLDLACGNNKKEGFIGIDCSSITQADRVMDLEKYPWDIENDSVYEIHCSHYIEHVSDLRKFAAEIYRILIPGGRVTFHAPYYSSIRATQDPTHKNFISEATFLYWNKAWMDMNHLFHYGMNCNFAIISTKFQFDPAWNARATKAKEWARLHYINVVSDIEVTLQAIKEG